MSVIMKPENKLYIKLDTFKGLLRSVELEEEQMDTLLEFSMDEYYKTYKIG